MSVMLNNHDIINEKFDSIIKLEDGWNHGINGPSGEKYNKEFIDWVRDKFFTYLIHDMSELFIYPTADYPDIPPSIIIESDYNNNNNKISIDLRIYEDGIAEFDIYDLKLKDSDIYLKYNLLLDDGTDNIESWNKITKKYNEVFING